MEKNGSYPEPPNIVVVKEFYTNVLVEEESTPSYTSYVRGKMVLVYGATINAFFGINE